MRSQSLRKSGRFFPTCAIRNISLWSVGSQSLRKSGRFFLFRDARQP